MNANNDAVERRDKRSKELNAERKLKEKLEKELARKDKALAETAALLALKKVNTILGTEEEEPSITY